MLEIGRAQGGVGIGLAAEQRAQIRVRPHALVDASGHGDIEGRRVPMRVANEVERIEHGVDAVAEQVADRGRPHERQEKIRARPGPVARQRIAERAVPVRHAAAAGHVDQAAKPEGRI